MMSFLKERKNASFTIALAGNPNVGKSTIFNALTGMHQHTGNWAGKTVELAKGVCTLGNQTCTLVDLPGCYSLTACSKEEEIARDFIENTHPDLVVLVCDAVCLERHLQLLIQLLSITQEVLLCVNLMDQAKKKGIDISCSALETELHIPVLGISAHRHSDIKRLKSGIFSALDKNIPSSENTNSPKISACSLPDSRVCAQEASRLYHAALQSDRTSHTNKDLLLDKLFTGKFTGIACMLCFLLLIFWITLTGANYVSQFLHDILFSFEPVFYRFLQGFLPLKLCHMLAFGFYRVTAWVISVMLPPMAIFFPLFTLLEDFGYLPRVAFNLDCCFAKCKACGKQALTMIMGFGCNAAGVTGCRIIDSPRERLIAILTNSFVPCNGRFPTILAILTIFFAGSAKNLELAVLLTLVILFGMFMTFVSSWLLSKTVLKGVPSSFTLELPPYRKPQIASVLVHSVINRTCRVLLRAIIAAAPAGILIWIMANVSIGTDSILNLVSDFLNPFARLLGLDGSILLAFLLGLPANEIVIPVLIMAYTAQSSITDFKSLSSLHTLLLGQGWTVSTAVSMLILCVLHWPCATTLLTIKKETHSLKWTALAFLLPTCMGFLLCFLVTCAFRIFS